MASLSIDDNFAASSDLRSGQIGRPQEIQSEQEARQRTRGGRDDSVELSPLGAEIARALTNEPPEVVNRIEQLQQTVAADNLVSPADELANTLINEALEADELEAQLEDREELAPASPTGV